MQHSITTLRPQARPRPSLTTTANSTNSSRPRLAVRAAPTRQYTLSSVDTSTRTEDLPLTADSNLMYLASNMGEIGLGAPASGYAGRWSRYQGPDLNKLLAEGDIIYGFRPKEGQPQVTQVWKAEEGDLNSPKLQAQRDSLPQLQKDPLQLQLDMDTLLVEVGPDTPLVQPSLGSVPVDKLPSTMKTLAVPDTGNVVVAGALPAITGPPPAAAAATAAAAAGGDEARQQGEEGGGGVVKGHPDAGKTWFSRLYLRAPGPEPGSSSRWSVMLHYDTTSGDLLTHYHTWEAGICPEPQDLQGVFRPGAHTQLMEAEQRRHRGIRHLRSSSECLSNIKPHANFRCSTLQYSADGSQCAYGSYSHGMGSSREPLLFGGPQPVEVWYNSSSYFRAPASLHPEALSGQDAVIEFGALIPAPKVSRRFTSHSASVDGATGLVRWLVCYSSTGDRRLKWARNELFTLV